MVRLCSVYKGIRPPKKWSLILGNTALIFLVYVVRLALEQEL